MMNERMINDKSKIDRIFYKYKKLHRISSFLYFLAALINLSFGIYYTEYVEIFASIFLGATALIRASLSFSKRDIEKIKRRLKRTLLFSIFIALFFSFVNPAGVVCALFDIYKRDYLLNEEIG